MKSIEDLDRWIGAKVRAWSSKLGGGSHSPEVLEIHRDILEDVRDRLEPKGQGRYFFPFNHLVIHVGAANESQESLYRAALGDNSTVAGLTLTEEIRALLSEAGAEPGKLQVDLEITVDQGLAWTGRPFRIDYLNRKIASAEPVQAAVPVRPAARLLVLRGEADSAVYPVIANRMNIGRMKEVLDERDGLRRCNDVAFAETEITVSREHAFVFFEPESGRFRLCDDGSQRGTSIFREGRRIEVPKGSRRGTQLQPGDEIHLGNARLRFEIVPC